MRTAGGELRIVGIVGIVGNNSLQVFNISMISMIHKRGTPFKISPFHFPLGVLLYSYEVGVSITPDFCTLHKVYKSAYLRY